MLLTKTSRVNAQTLVLESSGQFAQTEGPVWYGQEFIYFTNIPNKRLMKFSVIDKTFTTGLNNSNAANGLTV